MFKGAVHSPAWLMEENADEVSLGSLSSRPSRCSNFLIQETSTELEPSTEPAPCGSCGLQGAHLTGSPGGGREEAWKPGWGSTAGFSLGSRVPGLGWEGLSVGSISIGSSGGSEW